LSFVSVMLKIAATCFQAASNFMLLMTMFFCTRVAES
jgi:hypothetical protein